jgi:hypothetical protein
MESKKLNTDYLVVGSGAMGMAFVDVLLSETDANIIIVDKHHKPGGHWNSAYPFVTLHQPSNFYGVSSTELSKGFKDEVGLNKGLSELASGAEVSAYFDNVMNHKFLTSGRVSYYPMREYLGNNKFTSITNGQEYEVTVNKRTVDATYLNTSVPSTHTPNFSIDNDVNFIPLNNLPIIQAPHSLYVVVGGGKTGIDACIWLLDNQVDPDKIMWIMPRDAWLMDRKNTQSTEEFFFDSIGAQAAQMEAMANASDIDNLFERLENAGVLIRIDKNIKPEMYHGATISELELAQLRRIKNVIRKGRVTHISKNNIVFEKGENTTPDNTLFIDCSASAIREFKPLPVFNGNVITLQMIRIIQPVFSAALIAHIEAEYQNDDQKNALTQVVPAPNKANDWLTVNAANMRNQYIWSQDKSLQKWLYFNRLDGFSKMVTDISKEDTAKQAVLKRLRSNIPAGMGNLTRLISTLKSPVESFNKEDNNA